MKHYHAKYYAEHKALQREKIRTSYSNNNSDENSETNGNDDSSSESDVDSRFGFSRAVPDDDPAQKKNIPKWKKRGNDAIAAKTEFERVTTN